MPADINSDRVQELIERGAQLVEALPKKEYEEEHLPGAVNIPLRRLDRAAAEALRRDTPVIAYCYDAD